MLHEDVLGRLRELLVEGRIRPGERIPERALCESFGISRTPLREALKVLSAEGHVVLLSNRGARAARLTLADMRDLFEVSAALEAAAGELACQRITAEQTDCIAALHRQMIEHHARRDLPEYYRCNRAIHEAIVRAAGNRVLATTYEAIGARIRRARFVAPMTAQDWQLAIQEHDAMLNALQRRDGAVLSLILRTHLRNKGKAAELAGFADVP